MSPAISIVLPTYNGSRYIAQSIESCLKQTFTDFELIIVNDCSTDNTLSIAESFAAQDPRIRVITNEHNKKLPLSLNTGFAAARGRYFTWTSDDNYYAPEALAKMFAVLEKEPDIDLVYCDYYLIDDENKITGTRKFGDINQSFNHWLGCGACFLYRSEVHAANNGYNPAAFLIEDYDFFVRAFMKFNFYYLPSHELYYYREHGASLTATQSAIINDVSKIFLERNIAGLEKKLPPQELGLLYRKFAVYYAVFKNSGVKYKEYLGKLMGISKKQGQITVLYVLARKLGYALSVGFSGLLYFFRFLLKGK